MKYFHLACVVAALLLPATLCAAPKLVEGHEKVAPGPGVNYSTRKPPYLRSVGSEGGEAIMVLRVFFNRAGRVSKIVPLGFRGDRRLLESTVKFATQAWNVRLERPRPIYWEIPVIFSVPGADSWVSPINRSRQGLSTEEQCAHLLRIIRERAGLK